MTIKAVGIKSIVNFKGNLIWVDDCIKAEPLQKALLELGQMAGSGEVSLMMRATVNGKIYQNDGDAWKEMEDFGVGYGLKTLDKGHEVKGAWHYLSYEEVQKVLNEDNVLPNVMDKLLEDRIDKYPTRQIDFSHGQPTLTGVFNGGVNVRTLDEIVGPTDFNLVLGGVTKEIKGGIIGIENLPSPDGVKYPSGFWDPLIKSEQARPAQGPLGQCVCDSGVLFNFGCKCGFFEKGK